MDIGHFEIKTAQHGNRSIKNLLILYYVLYLMNVPIHMYIHTYIAPRKFRQLLRKDNFLTDRNYCD